MNGQMLFTDSNFITKNDETKEGQSFFYTLWIFQTIIWLSIIAIIVGKIINNKYVLIIGFIFFGITYPIYIIIQFCSTTCQYLKNINTDQNMYEKMGRLFITPPVINFYAECYHYVTHHYTTRDKKGHTHRRSTTRKVVTYRDSYNLPYYSCKDVSGLFLLNSNEAEIKNKIFIKLNLKKEINFADTISYSDYIGQKDLFWKRNRYLDRYMDFRETRYIPGMEEYNLIKIGKLKPKCFGTCWFVLSVLLTVGQFYNKYIDSFCIYQKFKIRKLISTRYNLLDEQYIQQYQPLMPQLNLVVQQFNYDPKNTGYCSVDVEPVLPTKEEIEQAEKYQDQIPNYGITSNSGVIQDIPQFNNPNYNVPPPAYISIGGDVGLKKEQINRNQYIPMNQDYIKGDFNQNNNVVNQNGDVDNKMIMKIN